jgi:hypothetical protein
LIQNVANLHEIQPFVLPDDDLARFGLATTGSIVPILADLATPDFLFVCQLQSR